MCLTFQTLQNFFLLLQNLGIIEGVSLDDLKKIGTSE